MAVLASHAAGRTFYVIPGESIQAAIDNAVDTDEIRVAPGTYNEAINFLGKAVRLYSSDGPEVTTIDGTGNYHVVQCITGEDPNTILEGFTITGGEANTYPHNRGGGMYNEETSPTVTNCIFSSNSAGGGGLYNLKSDALVSNCTFIDNHAGSGGGMYSSQSNLTVTKCVFSGNTASAGGGGMYNWKCQSIKIVNCTFTDNDALDGGGMINQEGGCCVEVTNCTFAGNTADNLGGGMGNWKSKPTITNCTFHENHSGHSGGGMYNYDDSCDPTIINCVFTYNSSLLGGGLANMDADPVLINCTFNRNRGWNRGGAICNSKEPATSPDGACPHLYNCILWDNVWPDDPGVGEIYDDTNNYTWLEDSDIEGGWRVEANNISENPLFIDAASGDLRLKWNSPCVDTGDNSHISQDVTDLNGDGDTAELIPFDRLGNPRIVDADSLGGLRVDMGAYEVGQVHNVTRGLYYNIIQNAIDNANDTDEIRVAPGTYYESIDFGGKAVWLYGIGGPEVTTIDGTGNYHVVQCVNNEDSNTVLDGFTITGGNANGGGSDNNGGGMYNSASSPTVNNCIFSGNSAYINGGGMLNSTNSSPIVTNCIFSGNSAVYGGGGMFNHSNSSPIVTNCTFTANSTPDNGGGMSNKYASNPTVTNCIFWGNTASVGNEIYNYILTDPAVPVISYSDIAGCGSSGAGWDTLLGTDGGGNVDGDPLFVDSAGGDYRLVSSCSPCVDTGSNAAPDLLTMDLQGNPRIQDGDKDSVDVVDMGVFEFNALGIHNITHDCWYQEIQQAIDHSINGEVIVLEAGTFHEAIDFKGKAITLQSTDPDNPNIVASTIIDATGLNLPVVSCISGEDLNTVLLGLTITGGLSNANGGGMYNLDSSPTVANSIFWGNWGQTLDQIYDDGTSAMIITFSNVNGVWPGGSFFDPAFLDPASGDFRLSWSSLCIDGGDSNVSGLPQTDLAGDPRIENGVVDMGVFEYEHRVSTTALQVNVTPQEAIDQGARWRLDGGPWLDPNEIVYGLEPGYHDVDFTQMPGWTEPQTLSVRVIGDKLVYKTAEYKPLLDFAIGEIPPRDVYHGGTLTFYVGADWLADPEFEIVGVTNAPAGDYSLGLNSGLFIYEPDDIADCTSFTLTFRATSGVDFVEQTVEITPIPDLPPEFTVFTEPVGDLPDPSSRDYIFINEIESDEPQLLNGKDRTVLSVTITGKEITVADVPGDLVYIYNDNYDISDLTIYAETLIIRDPLNLHQTEVTIYAKQLRFEGDLADINTTPENQDISQDDGLNGGDTKLYIESLDLGPGSHQRFKTSGIVGNDGWPGYSGAITCTMDTQQPFAWMSPYALKMVIAHAKDAYLHKYDDEAYAILTEYQDLLNTYIELPGYNSIPQQWQFEFEQMYQEIINLVHRLENGLDYFGNPPGWTPMLSFEVWEAAYEDEIERAINILYLSYWLQNIADDATTKADALREGREKLWAQTVQFKGEYEGLTYLIDPLRATAEAITIEIGRADQQECSGLLCQLKNKEAELLARADRNVEESHKVPVWRKALKSVATIATSTLQGASTSGKAGAALGFTGGMITAADDLFLSDDAWQSASATTDVAREFNNIDFQGATQGCLDVFNEINNLGDLTDAGAAESYMQELRSSAKQMAKGLYDVKETLRTTSLDNKEVEAELNKIKAADPTFNYLIDRVTELTVMKEAFNSELAAAMQKISTLSNGISNNILAIDAMNRQASLNNRVLDERALMYVKDMEHRARARLLKYHYYMAKAYEYRVLQQYEWPLDIQGVFDNIATMADADSDAILSPADFDVIKGVYDGLMSEIRNRILSLYSYEQEHQIDMLYTISTLSMPKQIAQLNADVDPPMTITIDLTDLIDIERENVRIVDMSVHDVRLATNPPYDPDDPDQEECGGNTVVYVKMEHSGVCNLQKGKDTYLFSYPEIETGIKWEGDCYVTGSIENSQQSYASTSILRALLPDLSDAQVMFYSRPAVWSDIGVYRNLSLESNCNDVEIESLTLRITYDYTGRNNNDVTLRVRTSPAELQPYFTLDTSDESEAARKDGIGDFYRTYIEGTNVTVTAPARYGDYIFTQWVNRNDVFIQSDPVLVVNTGGRGGKLYTVEAQYEYDGPVLVGDINADLNIDLGDFSAITAAWLTELGDSQWDVYSDISDPADYRIDLQDLMVLCNNWLAIP